MVDLRFMGCIVKMTLLLESFDSFNVHANFFLTGHFNSCMFTINTLAARGLEELRVDLLLKENSYVSYIILH